MCHQIIKQLIAHRARGCVTSTNADVNVYFSIPKEKTTASVPLRATTCEALSTTGFGFLPLIARSEREQILKEEKRQKVEKGARN
jgi:hypothetical protein